MLPILPFLLASDDCPLKLIYEDLVFVEKEADSPKNTTIPHYVTMTFMKSFLVFLFPAKCVASLPLFERHFVRIPPAFPLLKAVPL